MKGKACRRNKAKNMWRRRLSAGVRRQKGEKGDFVKAGNFGKKRLKKAFIKAY